MDEHASVVDGGRGPLSSNGRDIERTLCDPVRDARPFDNGLSVDYMHVGAEVGLLDVAETRLGFDDEPL